MPRTTPQLPNALARSIEAWGSDVLAARRAQGRSAEHVALAAGITRKTLQRVERGDPAVALGIYVRVLDALGLMGSVEVPSTPARPVAIRRDPRSLDARSLAMHQSIAAKLRQQPALLGRARATIDRWQAQGAGGAARPYLEAWRHLIDQGLDATLAAVTDPGERGNAMRQASPFTGILDNRERWALLRDQRV